MSETDKIKFQLEQASEVWAHWYGKKVTIEFGNTHDAELFYIAIAESARTGAKLSLRCSLMDESKP